ncbi:uncharacterized protein LOC128732421 [Sabethes cyaneus]|uniref:uncharacterized protein LOC128732421 n=1 Tax=Sabethes cyaneus TaxID=53552 RepID=UPI00237EC626|nr:uncharacterized protein LOC128732421 [Sabethes cyaneus]
MELWTPPTPPPQSSPSSQRPAVVPVLLVGAGNGASRIAFQNVGGMNTSVPDYLLACADSPYEIIVLTETWLDNRTCSRQIFGPNYEVFRCDRSVLNSRKATGGGVLIAVHRQLQTFVIENVEWLPVEQEWVNIKLSDRRLFLCAIYVPPDRIRDPVILNAHINSVYQIASMASASDDIIILGDFNLPSIKWRERGNGYLYADMGSSTLSPINIELLDCYSTATVQQVNDIPNENGRLLDLCFASVRSQAPEVTMAPTPLVKHVLHHPGLLITTSQQIIRDINIAPPAVFYDYAHADFGDILNVLGSINWSTVLDNDDINTAATTFSNILNYVIDRHVPKRTAPAQYQIPWLNTMLRRLKSERKAALKKFTRHRTLALRNHYLSINIRYKRLSRSCFRNYLRNVERRLKRNPKSFWKYVNEQRKDDGLPSVMFLGDKTASNSQQISELFSMKFSSVFTDASLTIAEISTATECVPFLGHSLNNLTIDEVMVTSAAAKLKLSRAVGPDGIPPVFLKKCIHAIAAPMSHLFSLSVNSGVFPSAWKSAYMFPMMIAQLIVETSWKRSKDQEESRSVGSRNPLILWALDSWHSTLSERCQHVASQNIWYFREGDFRGIGTFWKIVFEELRHLEKYVSENWYIPEKIFRGNHTFGKMEELLHSGKYFSGNWYIRANISRENDLR